MKNFKLCLLLVCCYFLSSTVLHAQKAKFRNKTVLVQKTRLPINYTDPENRTYELYTKGAYSTGINTHEKKIHGWTLDAENPKLKGVVSIYGFSMGRANKSSQKKQKKDKDGKVTDRWTEYTYSATAQGRGTLYIYGLNNPFDYKKKDGEKSKAELKRDEKAAAKKKELEANPFLSSEDVEEAEDSDIGEDEGLEGEVLELIKTVNVNTSSSVKTGAYRSSSAAYKEYKETQRPKLYKFKNEYPDQAYNKAINNLNYLYGYTPVKNRLYLKRMKSKKHKSFQKWNDAIQATETLFKVFKYNKSIESNQPKFDPIVEYFTGIIKQIPDGDRKTKKMKKAAFQNATNILYFLDKHDEVIELCKKYSSSKVLKKSAKRALNRSERLKALLAFHNMTTCHMETTDEEISDDEFETEEEDATEMEESNK